MRDMVWRSDGGREMAAILGESEQYKNKLKRCSWNLDHNVPPGFRSIALNGERFSRSGVLGIVLSRRCRLRSRNTSVAASHTLARITIPVYTFDFVPVLLSSQILWKLADTVLHCC